MVMIDWTSIKYDMGLADPNWILEDNILQWLDENAGIGNWYFSHKHIAVIEGHLRFVHELSFKNKEAAILFRLTWE